jgi:trimethylamine---corrinoid protein Co-methyltransferase
VLINDLPRYEILDEAALAELERGWRRIVSELGIEFLHPDALEYLREAGQEVDGELVRFDPDWILEQVAKAPAEFDLQARNPERTVHIGGNHMVFSAVYGCPFVREGDERRDATSRTSSSSHTRSTSSTRQAGRSASRTTSRSTRGTSTWCSRC